MLLRQALEIAKVVERKLDPYCSVCEIAGSIRRQKSEVKDIEIVCLPFFDQSYNVKSLFGGVQLSETPIRQFTDTVNNLGRIKKGSPLGRYCQIELPQSIVLDLFIPKPYDYFRQFAIRTGPAGYSGKVIARGWKKLGWCGTEDGLRLISECDQTKSGWKCLESNPTLPPIWQSESEFYQWLGIPWQEPEKRK